MNSTAKSTESAVSPLLALPVELTLEIISHLGHDVFPSRACLRRTHSSFLQLIPKADIRSKLSDRDLSEQLLKAELEYEYLLPHDHYPCYYCARVLPLDAFTVTLEPQSDGIDADTDTGYRACQDCREAKPSSYRRSSFESLLWIACNLDDLPMPPSRPQLRTGSPVMLKPQEREHLLTSLRRRAQDHAAINRE